MTLLQWMNPLYWFRTVSHFVWCWFVTLPLQGLAMAAPAVLALAAVTVTILLTYTSDPQWRRSLVTEQLRSAKQGGSNGEVALTARRLLMDAPEDLDLRFEVSLAALDGDRKEQAMEALHSLAIRSRHGRSAIWLLEHDFLPIQWEKWDERKRIDFGNLLEVAAEDQPENKSVASIYADFLLLKGSREKALGEISKLVSVQPARALQGAIILRESGRESQAAAMAKQGFDLLAKKGAEEPENVNLALMRAQFALFLKQYETAINLLGQTAKLSDDVRLRTGAAESLVLWSRDQAAITNPTERFARQLTLLSKAVEMAPNHPLVLSDLITIALQCADEKDERVTQLRDLLVQGVAPELAHFVRGTSAMMREDLEEATVHLELAAKGLPSVPAVLNNLAVALATQENADLERALRLVDAAIQQVPNQPYFYETRAQIMLKKGEYTDAVSSFERALPAEALREQVHDGLAQAYASLGQQSLSDQHKRFADSIRDSKKVQGPMDNVKVDFSREK